MPALPSPSLEMNVTTRFEAELARIMDEAVRELGMSQLPHGLTDREFRFIALVQAKAKAVKLEERARVASE
jgi:hypothetical protein